MTQAFPNAISNRLLTKSDSRMKKGSPIIWRALFGLSWCWLRKRVCLPQVCVDAFGFFDVDRITRAFEGSLVGHAECGGVEGVVGFELIRAFAVLDGFGVLLGFVEQNG